MQRLQHFAPLLQAASEFGAERGARSFFATRPETCVKRPGFYQTKNMKIVSFISAALMFFNVTQIEENTDCETEKSGLTCPNRTKTEKVPACQPKEIECSMPYLVSIQIHNGMDGFYTCAGILIQPDWVLTTAHCLESEGIETMWVVTGVNNLEEAEEKGQRLIPECYFIHEKYKEFRKSYQNDIALIHLEKEAELDRCTGLADLSVIRKIQNSKCNCSEVGWGAHNAESDWPVFIQPRVQLIPSKMCKKEYNQLKLPSCCICGKTVRKTEVFCEGDNGGVLICQEKKTLNAVITGIMSWRDGCDKKSKPTVYTNIALFKDWINENLAKFAEDRCPCKSGDGRNTKRVCPTTTTIPPTTTTTPTTTTPTTTTPTTTTTTTTTTTSTTTTPTTTTSNPCPPKSNPCPPPSNPCPDEDSRGTKRCPETPNPTEEPCTIETTTPNPCQTTTTTENPCFTTTTIAPNNCTRKQYVKTNPKLRRRHRNTRSRNPYEKRSIDFQMRKESRYIPL